MIDLFFCNLSMVVAYLIGHNLNLDLISVKELSSNLLVLSVLNTLIFFNFKTYSGIVRYTGVQDAFRVTFSLLVSTVVLGFLSLVSLANDSTRYQFQSNGQDGSFLMLYPEQEAAGLYVEKQGYLPKIYNVDRDSIKNVKDLKVELVPIASGEEFVFENVFFDFDSFELKHESLSSLRRLDRFLQDNPKVSILITGHTDNLGSDEYNL